MAGALVLIVGSGLSRNADAAPNTSENVFEKGQDKPSRDRKGALSSAKPGASLRAEALNEASHTRSVVQLRLRTGGAIDGTLLDYNEHGLVILHEETPYVFAWSELEGDNAFATRGRLLIRQRGGYDRLSAEDHFYLGTFALRQERRDAAAIEFRRCKRIEPGYRKAIGQAVAKLDRARKRVGLDGNADPEHLTSRARGKPRRSSKTRRAREAVTPPPSDGDAAKLSHNEPSAVGAEAGSTRADRVEQAYRTFGAKVQEVLGRRVALVESPHFLIWTDWRKGRRGLLASWCEAMYAALRRQFKLKDSDTVFPVRCPMFCFRSKARFQQFARYFDGYDGVNSIGYTRSIEKNGHVHVVALRQGASPIDFDRFAWTLVHEGTHAFVHRLHSTRLIPHWINEGLAELTAERVLGDRCPAGETAALLARQIVRRDVPITKLLHGVDPIAVSEYPIAESVVTYLDSLGTDRLAGFIFDLKADKTVAEGLADRYDAMTLEQLETRWRAWVRSVSPDDEPSVDGNAKHASP